MEMSNITARVRDQIASLKRKERNRNNETGEVSFIGTKSARVIDPYKM